MGLGRPSDGSGVVTPAKTNPREFMNSGNVLFAKSPVRGVVTEARTPSNSCTQTASFCQVVAFTRKGRSRFEL